MSYILIVFAGVLWATLGAFSRLTSEMSVSSAELLFFRALITMLCMIILALIKSPKLFKIRLRDLWIFVGMGIVSYAFFAFCYLNAISLSSISVAAALLYTAPVFAMLFSAIIFKEKLSAFKIAAIIITVGGCFLVAGGSGFSPLGILYGVLSGLFYGLYGIFGRYAVSRYHPLTSTVYTFIIAVVFIIPFVPINDLVIHIQNPKALALCVACGFFTGFLPYLCYTTALKNIMPGAAAITATIEPVAAAVISVTFFNEVMTPLKLIGIILIIVAVIISPLKKPIDKH